MSSRKEKKANREKQDRHRVNLSKGGLKEVRGLRVSAEKVETLKRYVRRVGGYAPKTQIPR